MSQKFRELVGLKEKKSMQVSKLKFEREQQTQQIQ